MQTFNQAIGQQSISRSSLPSEVRRLTDVTKVTRAVEGREAACRAAMVRRRRGGKEQSIDQLSKTSIACTLGTKDWTLSRSNAPKPQSLRGETIEETKKSGACVHVTLLGRAESRIVESSMVWIVECIEELCVCDLLDADLPGLLRREEAERDAARRRRHGVCWVGHGLYFLPSLARYLLSTASAPWGKMTPCENGLLLSAQSRSPAKPDFEAKEDKHTKGPCTGIRAAAACASGCLSQRDEHAIISIERKTNAGFVYSACPAFRMLLLRLRVCRPFRDLSSQTCANPGLYECDIVLLDVPSQAND